MSPPAAAIDRRSLLLTGGAAVAGGALGVAGTAAAMRSQTPAATPAPPPALAFTEFGDGIALPHSIADDASPAFRGVAEALLETMQKTPFPGAALGLFSAGREEYAYFGIESLNTNVTVGPDTLFQLGSLTKTYTATTIWRLIDQGKLKLDGLVRDYLPGLRLADEQTAAQLTIAQLLDHTAGFYGSDGGYAGEDDGAVARYVEQRISVLPQQAPLGQYPSYNNDGFILLGRLIEVATGASYRAAIVDALLGPLQLGHTVIDRATALTRPHVDGHYAGPINGDEVRYAVQTPLFAPRAVEPAGGLWATVRDVIAYARFHLALGRRDGQSGIVSIESLQQMQTPVKAWPGLEISIGRNWFVQLAGGRRVFTHNGDTAGCHAVLVGIPDQQIAVALLVNVSGGFLAERAVLDAVCATFSSAKPFAGTLGTTQSLLAAPNTPTITVSAAELSQYAGEYRDPGQTVSITEGGPQGAPLGMSVQPVSRPHGFEPAISGPVGPAAGLGFLAEDRAVVSGIERLAFLRETDGRVGWQASGLRLVPRTGQRR